MIKGRKYWDLTSGEQIGFTLMAVLILLVVATRAVLPALLRKSERVNIAQFDSIKSSIFPENKNLTASRAEPITFSFNANLISFDSLLLFGLESKEANTFLNYRSAIGGFSKKEQLLNLYGFRDEAKLRVYENAFIAKGINQKESLLALESAKKPEIKKVEKNKPSVVEVKRNLFGLELNSATEQQLQMIGGIGPALSKRIINYRNSIGGFKRISQLYNVYGLDSSKLNFEKVDVSLDTNLIRKIPINSITAEDLAKHPIFWGKKASIIINYRVQHGSFFKPKDLLNTKVINEEELKGLKGYLQFD